VRANAAADSEPVSDIRAIAKAAGIEAARQVLAEHRDGGLAAPKTWLTQKDLAADGPYTEPTLCTFSAEGRGPKFISVGGYKLCRRDWWDSYVLRGGPSAFELGPDGKKYRLKPEFSDGSDANGASRCKRH
jgi:hypothetical protein